jgi:hypothetical protein
MLLSLVLEAAFKTEEGIWRAVMTGSCNLDDVVVPERLFTITAVYQTLHILVFRWMILMLKTGC